MGQSTKSRGVIMPFKEAIKQHYENVITLERQLANAITCMRLCVNDEIARNPNLVNEVGEETNRAIRNVMGKHPELWNPEAFKRKKS